MPRLFQYLRTNSLQNRAHGVTEAQVLRSEKGAVRTHDADHRKPYSPAHRVQRRGVKREREKIGAAQAAPKRQPENQAPRDSISLASIANSWAGELSL